MNLLCHPRAGVSHRAGPGWWCRDSHASWDDGRDWSAGRSSGHTSGSEKVVRGCGCSSRDAGGSTRCWSSADSTCSGTAVPRCAFGGGGSGWPSAGTSCRSIGMRSDPPTCGPEPGRTHDQGLPPSPPPRPPSWRTRCLEDSAGSRVWRSGRAGGSCPCLL